MTGQRFEETYPNRLGERVARLEEKQNNLQATMDSGFKELRDAITEQRSHFDQQVGQIRLAIASRPTPISEGRVWWGIVAIGIVLAVVTVLLLVILVRLGAIL